MKLVSTKKWITLICVLTFAFGIHSLFNPRLNGAKGVPDAKAAIAQGDTRFVSVLGMTVGVSGIPSGHFNGLVLLHGMKPPIGVGDFIPFPWQHRQQAVADEYAHNYNLYLLKYLLDHPDAKTVAYLKQVDNEMQALEKANPQTDAKTSFAREPQFLSVIDSVESGYASDDWRTAHMDHRTLKMNAAVLRGEKLVRYNSLIKNYVMPYNSELYRLLQQKWKRAGVETPADIDKLD